MSLVVTNTTGSPIEISELGITVQVSEPYDLSYRQSQIVAASVELAGHIANGSIVVTEDTLNTLSGVTGITRLPTGLESEPVNFRVDPATSILYRKAANGKYLSVSTFGMTFSHSACADLTWLNVDSNIVLAYAGYGISFDCTIVSIGIYADNPYSYGKHISIYRNNVETPDAIVLPSGESSTNHPFDFDFGPQDTIRFRLHKEEGAPNNQKYGGIRLTAFFSLRNLAMEAET